ncbi:hypothetical protein J3R82DRAFT_11410 [Butyriboletus roseoflavus]|nr:hypothetical protein J3R82DRAFT_11410 [Butyriboletus roseoflavus]
MVTITAAFNTEGGPGGDIYTVQIENQNTVHLVAPELFVPPSDSEFALCGRDARWGVGLFHGPEGGPPLANFGTVIFTNAIATGVLPNDSTVNGNDYNPLNATMFADIAQLRNGDLTISTYVNTARDSVLVQYLSG